ncbi:Rab11 [Hexamita inflata]|uniref:Rab11 n=1 Tax=Hexamita inflata TaxID=28002 RepID=A0AA86PEE5_9EUKA|nr:Rab11 [Hexamita inflata]
MKSKIVLLGDTGVGKTTLIQQFTTHEYNPMITSSLSAACVQMQFMDKKLEIWDTAGQEKYNSITPIYYRKASCVLLVFDLSHSFTFERVKWWFEEVRRTTKTNMIVVGNKSDLKRKVSPIDVKFFVESNKLTYFETSSKTGDGVKEVLKAAAEYDFIQDDMLDLKTNKKGCC